MVRALVVWALVIPALLAGAVPAHATSMEGPSWVPAGHTGCWQIDGWDLDFPVDVTWGDGKSATEVAQPFCHSYRSRGSFTVEATRFDIDAGTIVLGRMTVSTQLPTFGGPYAPGTTEVVSPVAGEPVEFRFSAPGPYDTASFGVDGVWSEAPGTTFTTSFSSEGSHSVGLRLSAAGWSGDYTRSIAVEVGFAPTTTTSTSTTTTSTTTTTVPETTTTTDPADATTTTTTLAVAAPGSDAPSTQDPTSTTLDPASATTTTAPGTGEQPGEVADSAAQDEEPDEDDLMAVVFDPIDPAATTDPGGASTAVGFALIAIGVIGGLGFGISLWQAGRATLRPGPYVDEMAADGVYVDDMAVPPSDPVYVDDMAADGVYVDDMVRPPTAPARRWVRIGGLAVSGVMLVIGTFVIVGSIGEAEATDASDPLADARASGSFLRELTGDDIRVADVRVVVSRGGSELRLADYVDATSLPRMERTRALFVPENAGRYLAARPRYGERVVELDDRLVVERVAEVDLADGACDDSSAPPVFAELCFQPGDGGPVPEQLSGELGEIRSRLASRSADDPFVGGLTVDEATRLSDEDLLGVLLNSGTKRIRHTSVIPAASSKSPRDVRGGRSLWDFDARVDTEPVWSISGFTAIDVSGANPSWSGVPETEERRYFLTGFTLGEEVEDSWEFEIAEESYWHDRWYLRLDYRYGYGFGLRAPFAVDVQHEAIDADSRRVAVSVSPVDVASDGSPAYQAVGLPSGKTFDGNEFVLELTAGCTFRASIPGPDFEEECPELDLTQSRDIPPVLGGERSRVEEWWLDGKTTGLWVDVGFASASLDTGVGLDVTNGTFSVDVIPTSGTTLEGVGQGSIGFSSRTPRVFTANRGDSLAAGFALSSPRSTFDLQLRPAVRAVVGVDISYYENEWTLGPWSIPIGVNLITVPLPHHAGTVSSHEYSIFGIDGSSTPTVPPSRQADG